MQKPSERPRQSNISYILLSVCVVIFLLYFVLSLPEGINAALSAPAVSVRGGAGILAFAYGGTDPTDDPGGGGDWYVVLFPGVIYKLCDNASEQVWLAYANGTAKPQTASRSVSFSQRDVGTDTLFVKNFNESLNAFDVYVYMSNHTLDSTKGDVRMSVIGKGSAEDPIPLLVPNASYNVSVGFVLRNYFGGDFNVSYAVKACGLRTYDEFDLLPSPAP